MFRERRGILKLINVTVETYPRFLRAASLLVGLFHVLLMVLFFIAHKPHPAYLNIVSVIVYAICFIMANSQENVYKIYIMFMVEITVFSLITNIIFSENMMFALYCIALIPFTVVTNYMLFAMDENKGKKFPLTALSIILLVMFTIEMLIANNLPGPFSLNNEIIIRMITDLNLISVIICTIIGSMAFLNLALEKDTIIRENLKEAVILRQEAESATAAKSEFLASMSHEIRTPINAVLGMDEMILMEAKDERILGYASDIKSAGNTLLSLINDILDTSKIEAGGMTIEPVEYSISSLLNDCYSVAHMNAMEKGLDLRFIVDPAMPSELFGDEVRIRQIITNLLSNAIKYTKVGGVTLDLNFSQTIGGEINLIIRISDTGIGIAAENTGKIFSSFKRVDTKANRNILGTGLGLSITKKLVDMMEGDIKVASVLGAGSVFTVTIPQMILNPEPAGEFVPRNGPEAAGKIKYFYAPRARLLVVDDMEVNLRVFRNLLGKTGMQVDTCLDGHTCLDKVAKERYDIIFLDHMMPGMDGIETMAGIRALSSCPNEGTPVIMLTANAVSGAREEYLSMGFADYLSKPIQLIELLELAREYLPADYMEEAPEEPLEAPPSDGDMAPDDMSSEEGFAGRFGFLDVATGLLYNGNDEDLYIMNMTDYLNEDVSERIASAWEDGNIKAYAVLTHALKSTSLGIGASVLSERAKAHELAAKAGDTEFIRSDHDGLITAYRELLEKLERALEG